MAAYGYFPLNTDYSNRIIYQKPSTSPTKATSTPTYSAPNLPPPRPVTNYYPTTQPQPAPTTTVAYHPVIVTTTASNPTTGAPATGDQFAAGTAPPATTTTATTATGTETSGGGGTTGGVDTRLLDLLGSAFQSQPLQQGFAPQSVSSDAIAPSKTNPMAIVVLAIVVMAGIYFWTHRRGAA